MSAIIKKTFGPFYEPTKRAEAATAKEAAKQREVSLRGAASRDAKKAAEAAAARAESVHESEVGLLQATLGQVREQRDAARGAAQRHSEKATEVGAWSR